MTARWESVPGGPFRVWSRKERRTQETLHSLIQGVNHAANFYCNLHLSGLPHQVKPQVGYALLPKQAQAPVTGVRGPLDFGCKFAKLTPHIFRRDWVFLLLPSPLFSPWMAQFGTLRRGGLGYPFTVSQAKVTPYKIDEGQKIGGGERGECAERSRESFWRLVEGLASHQSAFEPPASVIFVTLTYGRNYDDWRTAKKHLEALRAYMTRHWGDRMTGIWVPEVQERGAPYFHFLLRWLGDEVAGADRSRWSKEKAGRDDGMLGAHWRKISGDGGSDPRHRRRYAVAIENVEGGPAIVARYLLKRLNRELAKTRQQIREHGDQAKVWTGRTWGRFHGHVLEQFYEPPVTVETCEAGVRLEAVNEVARQVFGFKLGEIYAKDVGSRWVPVKRDDPDAQLFTP